MPEINLVIGQWSIVIRKKRESKKSCSFFNPENPDSEKKVIRHEEEKKIHLSPLNKWGKRTGFFASL